MHRSNVHDKKDAGAKTIIHEVEEDIKPETVEPADVKEDITDDVTVQPRVEAEQTTVKDNSGVFLAFSVSRPHCENMFDFHWR